MKIFNENFEKAKKWKLNNIRFFHRVQEKKLPDFIQRSDIQLGIFGNTIKTKMVIPNKVYSAVAMKKPVITADTPAIRELFSNYENCVLCKIANGKDLAKKIEQLYLNPSLRNKIATK